MRLAFFAVAAAFALGGAAALAQEHGHEHGHEHAGHGHEGHQHGSDDATASHSFKGIDQWVERFEDPDRLKWQNPQLILRIVGLSRGDSVADLGTGTGYFLPYLSAVVGNLGQVYAVDIEQEMLDYIAERDDIRYDNVKTVLAATDDPKLPEGELDCVLIVNTWHHIDDRMDYLKKLATSLRTGGRVVVVDYHTGPLPVGPPVGHKLAREKVVSEFDAAGWKFVTESSALPYQYLMVFYPPG